MLRSLAVLILLAGPALADDDAARRTAAERYVASPAQQELLTNLFSPEAVLGQMQAAGGGMTPEQQTKAAAIITEEIDQIRPLIENAMTNAVANTLSLSQIEAIDAFYRTPEGMAVLRKSAPLMGDFWNRIGPVIRESQRKTNARLKQELQ